MNNVLSLVPIIFLVLSPWNIYDVNGHVSSCLSFSMSWICFRKAVLNPLCVGKTMYSNKEKFGFLDNLEPPLPLFRKKAELHRFC